MTNLQYVDTENLDAYLTTLANYLRQEMGLANTPENLIYFTQEFKDKIKSYFYSIDDLVTHNFEEGPLYYYQDKFGTNDFSTSNITEVHSNTVTNMFAYVFYNCKKLTTVDLPTLQTLASGGYQFAQDTALTDFNAPLLESVGQYMFQNCTNLEDLNIPSVESIGAYGFQNCSKIISLPSSILTTIGNYAFVGSGLQGSISSNTIVTVGTNAFQNLTGLTGAISLPNATSIGTSAFQGCSNITSFSAPKHGSFYNKNKVLAQCRKLTHVDLPSATVIGANMFHQCTSLQQIVLPKATDIYAQAFDADTSLEDVDLGPSSINFLRTISFRSCSKLNKLILRRTGSIAPLSNVNNFESSSFASGKAGATLYVPQDLIDAYKAGTNWSTILGYTDGNGDPQNQILPLEGSPYEFYYIDGTPLPQPITLDVPRTGDTDEAFIACFSPTNLITTLDYNEPYSNSFNLSPFSPSDFDITITMNNIDVTSSVLTVNGKICSISIPHLLGPLHIRIAFNQTPADNILAAAPLKLKNTGGSITTPEDGWRTFTSTANASYNLYAIYSGAASNFRQINTLYGHTVRVDLELEWLTNVSGSQFGLNTGSYTSINGNTPTRHGYEACYVSVGNNFNNSILFKIPEDKDGWSRGSSSADTDYFTSRMIFYSNKTGSVKVKSINFYDLGILED